MGDRRAGEDAGAGRRRRRSPSASAALVTVPIMLVVANGVGRILMNGFNNLRDALFAKVGQHAVRQLAYRTFVHMHELSLRYHLQRRTGGLSRIIERGINGIEIDRPLHHPQHAADHPRVRRSPRRSSPISSTGSTSPSSPSTVVLYVWFTVKASNWRIAIRRAMNESDNDANSKAIELAAQLRDGQIFRQRDRWRRAASTAPWRATSRRRSASGPRSPGSISARSSSSPPA